MKQERRNYKKITNNFLRTFLVSAFPRYPQTGLPFSHQEGFTLIELIIVVAMTTILGIIAVPFYSRFLLQNEVANTADQLSAELHKAQTYAMSGKQNSNWGVSYSANQITLFQGNSADS